MTCNATSPGSRSIEPLYLALNAAEERLQIVFGPAAGPVAHVQEWSAAGKAMQFLAPALRHAFASLGLPPESLAGRIAGIACVRGPGNFTGLRLSLATALGLSKPWGIPLAGVEYLPLLAMAPCALLPDKFFQSVWVLTHARQGEVYIQGFSRTTEADALPSPLSATAAVPLDTALDLVRRAPMPCVVLGGGLRRHPHVFCRPHLPETVAILPSEWDLPRPALLLRLAAGAEYGDQPVAPLYVRPSDAEENMAHIARKQGRDPESMRRDYERLTSMDMPQTPD